MIGAIAVVTGLVIAALVLKPAPSAPLREGRVIRDAPSPWIVGLVALLAGGLWFELLGLPAEMKSGPIVLIPMILILAVIAGVVALIRNWPAPGRRWTDLHRVALVDGASLTTMLIGYFRITAGNHSDQLFQGIVSLICFVLLALFTYHVYQRDKLEWVALHQE